MTLLTIYVIILYQIILQEVIITYTVNSVFSGGGGLDLGFKQAGFKIINSLDINKDCCETLRKNYNHNIICDDINNITLDYSDLLIGGSPCQSLSNANRNNNSKIIDDLKNKLILSYIKKVLEINPLVFVFENVPQVITASNGQFVEEFKDNLPDYHIEVKILNSYDYGLAQIRKRALFIGSKIGEISFPKPIHNELTVKDAFKNLNWNIFNQLDYSKSNKQSLERMSYVRPGHNWKDIPELLRGKWTHSSMYRRLEWDKPSVTITNFRKTMLLHPEENRIISVREAARLQGFPDDYIFVGSLANKQQMVADAVPVTMVRILADSIKRQMDELLNKENKNNLLRGEIIV